MKKLPRLTIVLLILLVALGNVITGNAKKNTTATISEQDKRKAEYIYLQAQVYKAQDSIAAYYDLIKYAYELDTTNTSRHNNVVWN